MLDSSDDWNRHWHSYADSAGRNPAQEYRRRLILSQLASDGQPRRVLDIGAGTGDLAQSIHRSVPGAEILGLDVSAEGLEVLPLLFGSPAWAAQADGHVCFGAGCTAFAPASTETRTEFADFAAAAVQRYGPDGAFWSQHPSMPARPTAGARRSHRGWRVGSVAFSAAGSRRWATPGRSRIGASGLPPEHADFCARQLGPPVRIPAVDGGFAAG